MKIRITRRRIIILLGFVGLAWAGLFVEIFKDVREHCQFTGSKRGWREYPLGIRNSEYYDTSPIETFIKENHSSEFAQYWITSSSRSRSWYGLVLTQGSGSPNALNGMPKEWLETFVQDSPPQEVKDFYDFLRTNRLKEETEVDAEIERVILKIVRPTTAPL